MASINRFYNSLIESSVFTTEQKDEILRIYKKEQNLSVKEQQNGIALSQKQTGRPKKIKDIKTFEKFWFAYKYGQLSLSFLENLYNCKSGVIYKQGMDFGKEVPIIRQDKQSKSMQEYEKYALNMAKNYSKKIGTLQEREEYIQNACLEMLLGLGYFNPKKQTFYEYGKTICTRVLDETLIRLEQESKKLYVDTNKLYSYKTIDKRII